MGPIRTYGFTMSKVIEKLKAKEPKKMVPRESDFNVTRFGFFNFRSNSL